MISLRDFDRPIFLVGCARSGTTLLAAPLYLHPDTGPKPLPVDGLSLGELSAALLDPARHLAFSEALERKTTWYRFFGQRRVLADMGRELVVERAPRGLWRRLWLARRLDAGLAGRRLFLKAPTNSFRVKALRELFPDARFLAIHRDGRDVVASWGLRPYGFARLGFEPGIEILARKWSETVDYLLAAAEEVPILQVRYERLLAEPLATARRALLHCDLDPAAVPLAAWGLAPRASAWRRVIPEEHHALLEERTREANARLAELLP